MTSREMILWEQHCCLPLVSASSDGTGADIAEVARYPLGSYVSVNVGFSPHSFAVATALAEDFRRKALSDGRFRMVDEVPDGNLITLAFDLEDSGPLEGDLDNVAHFHRLGVRSMLPSYNWANAAGCGCLDTDDTGLTGYGRDLVAEMNRVGMMVDGSHCSTRTGLDLASATQVPMIYSHSNFSALCEHPRNITDEQAVECARTGGVVGINGVGIFLGPNGRDEGAQRVQAMADHIEYGVDLLGIDHIGIGSDYSFDHEDFNLELATHPEAFSEEYTKYGMLQWVPPEDVVTLPAVLRDRGFDEASIAAVYGGNFARVAARSRATGR
ncbi:membrane dipeptidase [Rhodococcus sp. 06-156-3C]|uniref:dipeptidase n=1 Tax=Nocardiaceae TaxID=85025 RepID=UPI000522E6AD|nr:MULTISPECIES: membrane dipeptidase [Rhodococcus]OZD15301.1 membrane dipeptidase [Rhodococcus sp. 06-156-4C]OZD19611.1 membrane dipeptidase [Rhodococcus sp. 06-156-4a]OZD23077.1 membrane dipeptidase [Rhodococcus sp. 06-156-3C]OZD25630.1 membrane dipeptidase [Rhodococcus sp. 06-156-3b]OZD37837.1 membrane dipeptidase [Rhodococcus sp. 06-156-3]